MLTIARLSRATDDCPMTTSTLSERLKKAMDHAGLSATQLEVAAELGKGFLSRPLAGKRAKMGSELLKRIADKCGVSYLWLSVDSGPMLTGESYDEPSPDIDESQASKLIKALFKVMDADRYAEADFRSARSVLIKTFASAREGTPAEERAKQALEAARALRIEGLPITDAAITARIAWGKSGLKET
jgi:hypothetical protein